MDSLGQSYEPTADSFPATSKLVTWVKHWGGKGIGWNSILLKPSSICT